MPAQRRTITLAVLLGLAWPSPTFARVSAAERFAREARDPIWAPRLEAHLGARMEDELPRLVPGLALRPLACRQTSCRISWKPATGVDSLFVMRLAGRLYGATGGGIGPAERRNEVFLHYDEGDETERLDPDATIRALEERRARRLRNGRP